MKFPYLETILHEQDALKRLKSTQKAYFLQLFDGIYGEEYLENRLIIGKTHHRIGLSVNWYIGSYSKYISLITLHLFKAFGSQHDKAQKTLISLLKLIKLDEDIAITTYIAAREEIISEQASEIMELSTPVIQVWDGIVAAHIIGTMDTQRTQAVYGEVT